jgi:hypothetical protein
MLLSPSHDTSPFGHRHGIPDDTSIISLMVLNTLHMIEPKNVTDADCKKRLNCDSAGVYIDFCICCCLH